MEINWQVPCPMRLVFFLTWTGYKLTRIKYLDLYLRHLQTWTTQNTCKDSSSFLSWCCFFWDYSTCFKDILFDIYQYVFFFNSYYLSSHMNNNSLSGQIPPELSRLPNLVHLWVEDLNLLSLPLLLERLILVHDLKSCRLLDNNNLSGYLPPELSEMPNLLILYAFLLHLIYLLLLFLSAGIFQYQPVCFSLKIFLVYNIIFICYWSILLV